jgi:GH43 family beta-xylosidase
MVSERVVGRAIPVALALCLTATGCNSGATGSNGNGPPPPPCTFTNPITPGADPWVVRHGDTYYFVRSADNGIWVHRSNKLSDVVKAAGVKVWTAPSTGWNRDNVWAPELHHIDGRWYIYYAAGPTGSTGAEFSNQRSGVLQSVGENPQGTYVDKGQLYTGDDVAGGTNSVWAIDLTVGRIGEQLYAVWSGWEQNNAVTHRVPQHTYIATMSDPWTISGNRVKLSSPVESWERGTELDLHEGAEFLVRGDQVFLLYSTRESFLPDYRLGQLRLSSPTSDPMNPASWIKSGPVFTGRGSIYGVGHASFTTSPDGTEDWIIYHSKTRTELGWDDRVIRMQKFIWNPDGSPNFGTPVPSGERIALPAGECSAASGAR